MISTSIKNILVAAVFLLFPQITHVRQRVFVNPSTCTAASPAVASYTHDACPIQKPEELSQVPKKKTLPGGEYRVQKKVKSSSTSSKKSKKNIKKKDDLAPACLDTDDVQEQAANSKTKKEQRAYRVMLTEGSLPVDVVQKPKKPKRKPRTHRTQVTEKRKIDYSNVIVRNYASFAYGFNKYVVPSKYWYTTQTTIPNSTGPNDAYISTNYTSMMPLFRAAIGLQFEDVPCWLNPERKRIMRFGFEVSFAKKRNAYKATYTNFFAPAPGPDTIYQDVTRGTFMFVGSFDIIRSRCGFYGLNLDLGVGLVGGALKNLQLYDFGTQLFRGEYLPERKASAGGFVGFSLVRYFDQPDVELDLSYRVVISKVQYKNAVIRTNGVAGSATYSNPAALSTPQYVAYQIGRGPSLRVYSNEVTLAMSKPF